MLVLFINRCSPLHRGDITFALIPVLVFLVFWFNNVTIWDKNTMSQTRSKREDWKCRHYNKRVQELHNSRNCSSACFITLDAVVGVHGGRLTVIHSWMKATGRKSGFYLNLLILQISKREPQVGTMVWPFSSNSVKVEKLVSFISYIRKCNERERSQCLKTRKYNEREWSQCLHLGGAGDGEVWLWVRPLQRAWDDNRLPGLCKTL